LVLGLKLDHQGKEVFKKDDDKMDKRFAIGQGFVMTLG